MVTTNRWARRIAGVALAVALVAMPSAAHAWSNGHDHGNGFGTHDWVLYQANGIAKTAGAGWLDWGVAQPVTDDPDTVLHDSYHHVYDVTGDPYGDAPDRVTMLYGQVVSELRDGDRAAASRDFGLLSHYYSDICNPLHTDQTPREESVHSSYETAVQGYTDAPGEHGAWIVGRRRVRVADAAGYTRATAAGSHAYYTELVKDYAADGTRSARVMAITQTSLDRAVNGLADLLVSAQTDARAQAGASDMGAGDPGLSGPTSDQSTDAAEPVDASAAVGASTTTAGASAVPPASVKAPSAAPSDPAAGLPATLLTAACCVGLPLLLLTTVAVIVAVRVPRPKPAP